MTLETTYFHPEKRKPIIKDGKVFKSVFDFQLTEEELKKARVELKETEENKKRCLLQLKERLASERTYSYCTDDSFLLRFLRIRKYDIEKAYKSVKDFYRCRKAHQDLFFTSPDFKLLLDKNILQYLPYTDSDGRVIFWGNLGAWDPKTVPFKTLMACMHAVCDVVTPNPRCQVNGVVGVHDARGIKLGSFKEFFSNNGVNVLLDTMQLGNPWRIKMLFVNSGRLFRIGYRIARPLLSKKINERIVLLGSDWNELAEHFDPEILPKRMGGALDEEELCITDHVLRNFEYLRREANYK